VSHSSQREDDPRGARAPRPRARRGRRRGTHPLRGRLARRPRRGAPSSTCARRSTRPRPRPHRERRLAPVAPGGTPSSRTSPPWKHTSCPARPARSFCPVRARCTRTQTPTTDPPRSGSSTPISSAPAPDTPHDPSRDVRGPVPRLERPRRSVPPQRNPRHVRLVPVHRLLADLEGLLRLRRRLTPTSMHATASSVSEATTAADSHNATASGAVRRVPRGAEEKT